MESTLKSLNDFSSQLTSLIEAYKTEFDNFDVKDEIVENIFKNFYQKTDKNIADAWVNNVFSRKTLKCTEKAKLFREEGNTYFKECNFLYALRCYNNSLSYAPYENEEFYLALANRSMVFFKLTKYQECIKDIHRCLETNYPENLKHKIYLRLANCYLKVNQFEDSMKILDDLKLHLNNTNHSLPKDTIDGIYKEVSNIEKHLANPTKNDNVCLKNIHDLQLPDLKDGVNEKFLFASNAVSLKYNATQGRYVVANKDLKMGDVLFVEKAFASVPIFKSTVNPEQIFDEKCYHCFRNLIDPLPCKSCKTLYCNENCRDNSWIKYHQWECIGSCIDIWTSIGVNFLALRMLLLGAISGFQPIKNDPESDVIEYGDAANNYMFVNKLVTNIKKIEKADIFPHIISAMMMMLYLKRKTDFFTYLSKTHQDADQIDSEDLMVVVGSTLLKHILQVISNANTIESVHEEFYEIFNSGEQTPNSEIYVHATGIYPSISMMNHSCDTNVSSYFVNDYIIVKANRDIAEGDEVFNSYGYDCHNQSTEERQFNLEKQHHFVCICSACTVPTKPEMFYDSLSCQKCQGCALSIDGEDIFKCISCQHEFDASNHLTYTEKATLYYDKYNSAGKLSYLKKCVELREKAFYKYNFSIYTGYLEFQSYYGQKGYFEKWWYYTKLILELDKVLLGEMSKCYAMNIRFVVFILIRFLTNLDINDKNQMSKTILPELISYTEKMMQNMENAYALYYPSNKINFEKLREKFQNTPIIMEKIIEEQLF